MASSDRLKRGFWGFVRSAKPEIDYLGKYRARVVSQNADGSLGLLPEDKRLPPTMDNIKLRHGIPGLTVRVSAGGYVLVGWENGDPSQPYAALWEGSESSVTEITIAATMVNVGGTGGKALVTKDDFDAHTHLFTGPSGPVGVPTNPAVGTINTKAK